MSCKNYNITNRNSKPNCRSTQTNYSHSKTANKISTQTPKNNCNHSAPLNKNKPQQPDRQPQGQPLCRSGAQYWCQPDRQPQGQPLCCSGPQYWCQPDRQTQGQPPCPSGPQYWCQVHCVSQQLLHSPGRQYRPGTRHTSLPPPPSPPLLPSPSRNNRKAPLKQGKVAPLQHNTVTDPRHSLSGLTQHAKAASLQHNTVTDPRRSLSGPTQHTKAASLQHNTVTDPRHSLSGLTQHAKAAPLQHRIATDPRPSPRHLMQQHTVPPDCNTLLLGDSIMRRVVEVKMSTGSAHVRNLAVPGLTVADLCEWLASLPPSLHIKQATFHVGINSCGEGPVSIASWRRLVSLHRRAFPQAVLQASSILPPFGQHPLTEAASRSMANLRQVCRAERVIYIDHNSSFLSPAGEPRGPCTDLATASTPVTRTPGLWLWTFCSLVALNSQGRRSPLVLANNTLPRDHDRSPISPASRTAHSRTGTLAPHARSMFGL